MAIKDRIEQYLDVVERAYDFMGRVPEAERLQYLRTLLDVRRGLKRVEFAAEERCSAATFGESQVGKSYLIGAMNSDPNKAFTVTNGDIEYNFINDINPSQQGTGDVEATGLVTRFTTGVDEQIPKGHLKLSLFSVMDLVLVMCDAYHRQVAVSGAEILDTAQIKQIIDNTPVFSQNVPNPILGQDAVLEIEEYLRNSPFESKVKNLLDTNSGFFKFLLLNVEKIGEEHLLNTLCVLWNRNKNISRLFRTLMDELKRLDYPVYVYVPFKTILKKHRTILDVECLNEIYDEPTPKKRPTEYEGTATVTLPGGTQVSGVNKGILSALAAELQMTLPQPKKETVGQNVSRDFLNSLDILDFPGERGPLAQSSASLDANQTLSLVFRRGKVSYLFSRYSETQRISSLMLCHHNKDSKTLSTMGDVYRTWVEHNVGKTPTERLKFMQESGLSPLFIICTWFNMDLEFYEGASDRVDNMRQKWVNRFSNILESQIIGSSPDPQGTHWFNNWDGEPFKNIYLLRDFIYSRNIFDGYSALNGSPESKEKHSDYLNELKGSFASYEFVQKHFEDAMASWDAAATVGNDGTRLIIASLNKLAPKLSAARTKKFEADVRNLISKLRDLLAKYYHDGNAAQEIRKAMKQHSRVLLQLSRDINRFGEYLDELMVDESRVYEIVHDIITHEVVAGNPQDDEYSGIFMTYGLSTEASREENLKKLCDSNFCNDEDELRQVLLESNIDLDRLLGLSQMSTSPAEQLVTRVEKFWYDDFLLNYAAENLKHQLSTATDIVVKLKLLYDHVKMHVKLTKTVDKYLAEVQQDNAVGMITDFLTMELNLFVSTFGYSNLSDEEREDFWNNVTQQKLPVSRVDVEYANEPRGVGFLGDIDAITRQLKDGGYNSADQHERQMKLPRFGFAWCWLERAKVGYLIASSIPNYNIEDNNLLGKIIEQLAS